jgi:hypothetical protein
MRIRLVTGLALTAAMVLVASFSSRIDASIGPIPLNCNRACLENVIDQYLNAVVAHDPKKMPFSADVRYTENYQALEIGDGFWKTAQARGKYKHIFADPEFGQVASMGTMVEAGQPLLMSLRLRMELGRITEVESLYYRSGGRGPNNIADMDKPHVPEDMWFKSIPVAQPRQELIAVADGYFTGLQKNDGKGINGTGTYPFTNDCNRIENGSLTASAPPRPNLAAGAIDAFAMDCMTQFKLGYYFVVQSIHGRRYPVVDQERGVVWAHGVIDQGTVNSGVLSDGRPYTFTGFNRPSSILFTEAFLIEGGKIRRVEMVGPSVPFHMNSPWPGGLSGN